MAEPIKLHAATQPSWIEAVMDRFDLFLADHANCERKASAQAMSFVVKFPDRTEILGDLIALAQEELDHFRQVYELMVRRGVKMVPDQRSPYMQGVMGALRHGREERFMDRLLLAGVLETRGCERFAMVGRHFEQGDELKAFYRDLAASEARHGQLYVDLATRYFSRDQLTKRLDELLDYEAGILQKTPVTPQLY